jgi:hypothetical protein
MSFSKVAGKKTCCVRLKCPNAKRYVLADVTDYMFNWQRLTSKFGC